MRTSNSRRKLFEIYSTNLKLLQQKFPELKVDFKMDNGTIEYLDEVDVCICPLCLRGFLSDSLNQKEKNPLTLEDIPPKSFGGKPQILTCKECNNKSGYDLDHSLLQHINTKHFLSFNEGTSINKVMFTLGNKNPVSSEIKITQNNPKSIFIKLKGESYSYIMENARKTGDKETNYRMNFKFKIPNPKKVSLALLRIGYLLLFKYFGNALFLSDNILKIVNQINQPEQNILPKHMGIIKLGPEHNVKNGVHILYKPNEFKSYLSVFDLKINKITEKFGVLLPGPGLEGWKSYKKTEYLNKNIKLSFSPLPDFDLITDKSKINGYYTLWEYFKKK